MRTVALRSCPDYLIVLRISGETGGIVEVYNGPGMLAWDACGKMVSDGTRPISLRKLAELAAKVRQTKELSRFIPSINGFDADDLNGIRTKAPLPPDWRKRRFSYRTDQFQLSSTICSMFGTYSSFQTT